MARTKHTKGVLREPVLKKTRISLLYRVHPTQIFFLVLMRFTFLVDSMGIGSDYNKFEDIFQNLINNELIVEENNEINTK